MKTCTHVVEIPVSYTILQAIMAGNNIFFCMSHVTLEERRIFRNLWSMEGRDFILMYVATSGQNIQLQCCSSECISLGKDTEIVIL